ncbi:MAG: L,D-transpeptidase family protein [Caldilineaceae bacterium]
MPKKNHHLLRLLIVAFIGASLGIVLVATPSVLAAEGERTGPPPSVQETPGSDRVPLPNDSAPVPPMSRAYMGAPLAVFDTDQDTSILHTEDRWIDVDLSEQTVIAFEGARPVRQFIISSGLPGTPTVTGTFRIRAKVRTQTMSGEGYSLPNVEWVQYFYQDYALHGSYWHNNFGNPMSHGCINMTNEDAKWLFDWTGPEWDGERWMHIPSGEGTVVVVHE